MRTNDQIRKEIFQRMEKINQEMDTILAIVNDYTFPRQAGRSQPVCSIGLLRKAVSTKAKIAEFTKECSKRQF